MSEANQNRFEDVPCTPRGHLGLIFYEAVAWLTLYLERRARRADTSAATVFDDFPFLADYWHEISSRFPDDLHPDDLCAALSSERERWEAGASHWLPLKALCEESAFRHEAMMCMVMSGLAEEDARFAALYSALQQPLGHRRPTLGLLEALVQARGLADITAWNLCHPLLEARLLEVTNRDAPRSEWVLAVPPPLWTALRGEISSHPLPGSQYHPPDSFLPVADLILPPQEIGRVAELGPLLKTGQTRTLVVRGLPGSERLELIGAVARTLGRGLLELGTAGNGSNGNNNNDQWRLVGAFCSLAHAMPVFSLDLGPGETFNIPSLVGYQGPVAIAAGREGGLTGAGAEQSITLTLEPETAEYRLRHWKRALREHPAEGLEQIASRFALPARHIRQAAELAVAYAALERRSAIREADVRQATRAISRQRLDSLATHLEEAGDWSHLVVTHSTESDLLSLQQRCRHREQLATALGADMPGGLNRGVRALFEGPSGTGKTLAARILATELGLDLYRVDLAAIVNKYIGETEKNLSRVLARAEDLDVVLLLDEGDALMTRRTEVKSAHDRYANLETNYLLQRLETYTGIVIVTTNAGNYIDSAFRRRIDVVVKFHLPGAEERWRLWQLHLPQERSLEPAALEQLALGVPLTGGQIRNAAVHAKLLALRASRVPVSLDDVKSAINVEYRKAGAAAMSEPAAGNGSSGGRLNGFLASIS
jgi:hypothetical protein